jgi:glycosyltransferase 2 family protein
MTEHRESKNAASRLRRYRNQLFGGFILVLALYVIFLLVADSQTRLTGTAGIGETLLQFDWRWVAVCISCQLLVIGCRIVEWQYLMGIIGARDKMSLWDSIVIFLSGLTLVVSPGKAAELLKAVFVKLRTGVSIARSAPVVVAERVMDGLAVIVLMVVTLVVAGNQLNLGTYEGVDYDAISRGIVYSSAALLLVGLLVVQIKPLAYFCLNLIGKLPLIRRLHDPLVTFYESSREIFAIRNVLVLLIPGTGVFLFSSLCFLFVLHGFGLELTWTLFLQATFIVGVTSAVGALSFVPNGAGVTEASNTLLLLAMLSPTNPTMTPVLAAAASLLQGFFHKWFRVLLGLVVAILYRRRLFGDDLEAALIEAETDVKRTSSEMQAVSVS